MEANRSFCIFPGVFGFKKIINEEFSKGKGVELLNKLHDAINIHITEFRGSSDEETILENFKVVVS